MPKENKIRILYVQPGKYPEERIIDNTLKAYQSLVYGDIESVAPWRTNVRVVCNQEGKLMACAESSARRLRYSHGQLFHLRLTQRKLHKPDGRTVQAL